MHVKCPQKFRDGSDFDGDVNAKVGKHLQRDCEFPADQISRLSIRDEGFGETTEAWTGDDQQSEPLKVNTVKAGDKEVAGSVFVLPGKKKKVQVTFPNFQVLTQDLQFDQSFTESGDASMGRFVPFKFDVPPGLELKEGNMLFFSQQDNPPRPGAGNVKNIVVYVKPADNGNGRAPGGGAGEKPRKPHAPGGGAGDNPRTGGGSSSFGSS